MPKIWKYNLLFYLKGFGVSLFCLTLLPYLSRITKIAEYAAMGASLKQFILLLLIYIPYFLPFVLGISALIAAWQTSSILCRNSELTAMRCIGLSIHRIFLPLFYASLLMTLLNFILIADWIPRTRYMMNNILLDETTINPLVLLKKQTFPHFENAFIEMKIDDSASSGKDLLMITKLPQAERLTLILSPSAKFDKDKDLRLSHVNMISHFPAKENYDHLLINYYEKFTSPSSLFSSFIYKNSSVDLYDILPLNHLLDLSERNARNETFSRIAKSIFPLVLTYVGFIFGIYLKRRQSTSMIYVSLLTAFYLLSYFMAKAIYANTTITFCLSFLPPLITLIATYFKQRKIEWKGL